MILHQIYARIHNGEVKNVFVCDDYETANLISRAEYGDDAFAVDCTQYACQIGDLYENNTFYRVDESGDKKEVRYIPTVEQQVETLKLDFDNTLLMLTGQEGLNAATAAMFASFANQMRISALSNTDEQALTVKALYAPWDETKYYEEGERVTVDEDGQLALYKARQAHQSTVTTKPSINTASLWTRIDEEHKGTKDDPIPAKDNMEYFKDKYYTYKGVLYLCTRNTEIPVAHTPDQLVNIYFTIVE